MGRRRRGRRRVSPAPALMELGDEFERIGGEDADLFGEPAKIDDDFVAFGSVQSFENEEFRTGEFRKGLMFDDLDEEAEEPIGKADTKNEKVALLKGLGELWELGELLIEPQQEAKHVVIPDHEIAERLGAAEDLVNEGVLKSGNLLREIRESAAQGAGATAVLRFSAG